MMFVVAGGPVFLPSGMTKNGTQTTTSSFADITSWTADTSNYPGSSVSSNALVAQGSKTGATLTANIPFSGGGYAFSGGGTQVRILVNGTVVATGTAVAANSGTATCTTTQNITAGDLVKVQILATLYSPQPTVTAGTGTYVRIT
ncbi:hypothetical protein OIE68_15645 [Nocardia vinacea]|uniref:hypothetical protein n=1 Tax=Nocardia vinacea TaxID=96468 RepID=UPI002E112180|nr:hypothetical protein OIE68_15645 [Nocardia vinacea]